MAVLLLSIQIGSAQQDVSKEVREKLEEVYKQIDPAEITLEKFIQINSHSYTSQTVKANGLQAVTAAA